MSAPHETLCDTLFALMSPAAQPDCALLARLDPGEWDTMAEMARQHRVLPLIHHRLRGAGAEWPVPATFRAAAAASFRRHSLRAVRAQRALVQCLHVLAVAEISVTALKGAWLAYHAYPQPGLRPLRDLDLLVPSDRAQHAFDVLVMAGFLPVLAQTGDLASYLKVKHQLPPLRCPETGFCVELHHRCLHGGEGMPDLPDDPAFHARLMVGEVSGVSVLYPGREHMLLHLVIHSAVDHTFDNGPGILPDLAMVLAAGQFDWTCFWSAAERFNAEAAAVLVLTMSERLWGVTGINWQGRAEQAAGIGAPIVQAAARLTLRDLRTSKRLAVAGAIDAQRGVAAKLRFLLGKIFPPPVLLRAAYPASGSASDLPMLYLRRWRDMVARRAASRDGAIAHDRARLAVVSKWLSKVERDTA